MQAGTYTLDSAYDSSARDGTAVAPVSIIGVKAATTNEPPVYADWGSGTDRPTFACGSNAVTVGDYHKIYNVIFTGDAASVLTVGIRGCVYNCKITNNSGTANRYGLNTGTTGGSRIIFSEFISTAGRGALCSPSSCVLFSYFHDSHTGILGGYNGIVAAFNVFDTLTTGISLDSGSLVSIFNNSFYNVTTCISASSANAVLGINNIIDTCTDGFKWTTQTDINFFSHNHVGNSVTDMWDLVEETAVPHKDNNVTGGAGDDPEFNDEANGDFKLAATSPCIDAGMSLTLGCSTASKMNQGAWDATTSSGGAINLDKMGAL